MTARRGVGLQCKHRHVNIYLCLEPEPPTGLPVQVPVAHSGAMIWSLEARPRVEVESPARALPLTFHSALSKTFSLSLGFLLCKMTRLEQTD